MGERRFLLESQQARVKRMLDQPSFLRLSGPEQSKRLQEDAGLEQWRADAIATRLQADRALTEGSGLMASPTLPSQRGILEPTLRAAGRAGLRAAPSIVGEQAAGAVARVTPSLRPLEVPIRAGGAMAGEAARQMFLAPEDEPFDVLEILAAGATPAKKAGRKLMTALGVPERAAGSTRRGRIRFARGFVPGSGVALVEQARRDILDIPEGIRAGAEETIQRVFPGETLGSLRTKALQDNPSFQLDNLQRTALEITEGEEAARRFGAQLGGRAARMARESAAQTDISLQEFEVVRRNLGGAVGQARTSGNAAVEGRLRALLAGFFQDVDDAVAAGVPGMREYKASLEGFRRTHAAGDFETLITQKFSRPARGENFETLNITQLLKDTRRAFDPRTPKTGRPRGYQTLPDFLTPSEKRDVVELLEFWNENLPALPTRAGINAPNIGSGQAIFRGGVAAGLATAANRVLGPTIDPQMAGLAGAVASSVVSNMMMSDTGRRILRNFIERGGPIDLNQMLGSYVLQSVRADVFSGQGAIRGAIERSLPPRLESGRQR